MSKEDMPDTVREENEETTVETVELGEASIATFVLVVNF